MSQDNHGNVDTSGEARMPTLYESLVAAGIPISNHESDLYFPITPESSAILAKYPLQKSNATTFTNQVEGGRWYDVPFAFIPWWEARTK